MFIDYYAVLEIEETATLEEIKAAFKKQAIKWHPDKNIGVDTTIKMQEINEAYVLLKDTEARERYDKEYQTFKQYQSEFKSKEKKKEEQQENKEYSNKESSKNQSEKTYEYYEYEINDDILNFDIVNFCKEKNITKVVSNLPYSISAKIITETIQNNSLDLMIFMIQKELAERLFAKPGSKKYNSLSILIQTFTKIEIICDISQSCFYPEPQVKSSLIKLIPNKIDLNFKKYNSFIRLIFSSKRKTLVNNAKNNYPKEKIISILKNLNLSIDIRPEKICVKTMIKIFESLSYED